MGPMRAVYLIGDRRQLRPTVMPDGANESAELLKQSLLSRLMELGYPQQALRMNYRNYPQILELARNPDSRETRRYGWQL
ncbi:hypothetical protein N7453_001868 [Penicillium expansum]|nr:hypothetical protein N7453_001868 [Penicillium expansum]